MGARESNVRADSVPRASGDHQRLLARLPRLAVGVTRRAEAVRASANPRRAAHVREENALAFVSLVRAAHNRPDSAAHQAHNDVSRSAHPDREHCQGLEASEARALGRAAQVLSGHKRGGPGAALQQGGRLRRGAELAHCGHAI